MERRSVLKLLMAGAAAPMAARMSAAASYPQKNITVICNFPPGNGSDIAVRFFADKLSKKLGQTIIVLNRVGAFGLIGARAVAESPPDGYTLFITGISTVISGAPFLYKDVPYDPQKAFRPIARLHNLPFVLTVAPNSPLKSVGDLTRFLKSDADVKPYGTAANPGTISAEMYLQQISKKLDRATYRDAKQAMLEQQNGLLSFAFFDATSTVGAAKSNQVRPLAVTSPIRMPALPDVPTMQEAGLPGYEMFLTWGVMTPAGVPDDIADILEKAAVEISADPETIDFISRIGAVPAPGTGRDLQADIKTESGKWAEYARLANIEPQ